MEPLILQGTQDTPDINLDKEAGELQISGSTLPEKVRNFKNQIIIGLGEY